MTAAVAAAENGGYTTSKQSDVPGGAHALDIPAVLSVLAAQA